MKKILMISFLIILSKTVSAQGCVAIRSTGNSCSIEKAVDTKGWQLNFNNRYFKSYKHFVGKEEQKHRVDSGSQVINHSYSLDITLVKMINNRVLVAATLPVISNARSSKYEHYGNTSKSINARRSTHSFGLGDVRFAVYRWMFDPAKTHKGNLQLGVGLKLPTGDFRYQDYFYKNDTTANFGPVDQSIQLGDGGTGITVEAKGHYAFSPRLEFYADAFYLINPREQNGVSTSRGGTPSAASLKYFTSTMSVPDQYMFRGGLSYMVKQFSFLGGLRVEGIPAGDLIGGDKGFRRPGYVMSAEPVVSFSNKRNQFYLAVPFALLRNRTQSYADKLQTDATGIKAHGDAAFADYSISIGYTIKI